MASAMNNNALPGCVACRARGIVAVLFGTVVSWCGLGATLAGAQEKPSDVPPLKDAFKDKFLIGAALDYGPFQRKDSLEITLAATHFNALTPENSMKPMSVQPA